ncbi:putative F-box protein At2g19630 [Rhodamnia argentea]|uniref:F-box protein At2g19630 n=1 Tax=Rhodamnia argentea TaxID=178133 RepID=A0A8B8QX10_9MYRT|nr:putative F-box protein At2g19630 [Rhodamnia argentea]
MKRYNRRKSSGTTDDDSIVLPEDLLIEILKRLPVKSLCRFRCVSTSWRSLISDPRFIDSHLTHSATRPNLIVSFPDPKAGRQGGLRIFSADQSDPRDGQHQMARPLFSLRGWTSYVPQSLHGLISLKVGSHVKICNPSTRKYVAFKSPRIKRRSGRWSYFQQTETFGFDPVERTHKVLSTWVVIGGVREFIMEAWVLTLGTKEWRRVEGCPPHHKKDNEFCFNGVVYYTAWYLSHGFRPDNCLVAFDVRAESFRVITIPVGAIEVGHAPLLIEFEGRVAMVGCGDALSWDEIVMWILEDSDREIWKKRVFVLPPCWKDMVADRRVFPVGTVGSGELLFAPRTLRNPVCVFYYNLKTNGCRRSEIYGLPEPPEYCHLTFSDHVESLQPPRGLSGGSQARQLFLAA